MQKLSQIKQQSRVTFKFVFITLIALLLSNCGKPNFEEFYLAEMAEIGNDVTGVKVIDRIEVDNYGVALTAKIIDGEGLKYVSMKPYEITADGWDLKPGSGCSSAYARLGSGNNNAYCGKIDPRYEGVTDVLLNDEKVKIIELHNQKYWYTVSQKDTAIISYVNKDGTTLKNYEVD
ncbi:hypothetical protein [Marinicella gelatinilytica]|uniref:hypothetical protein n=1 Tax=Marinicella gelatinilytica TaxID=2996017 RepID=UPI00226090AB|nr:hypothetical protein [Marinicella gelatinilytica]MCX7544721.1 hypothetical protein [Marinicella gelatinilytica]